MKHFAAIALPLLLLNALTLSSCKARRATSASSPSDLVTTTMEDRASAPKARDVNTRQVLISNGDVEVIGGDGLSYETAIEIQGAANSSEGIPAEYAYISYEYGERGTDWRLMEQSLVHKGGKSYDVLKIYLIKEKEEIEVYFDISDFFGKW